VAFDVRYTDLAGRIGRLDTPHGILETPAFIPVVHPVKQSVSTQFLKDMGFAGVITNAYITLRHYGDDARKRGIHDIIHYDGVVMTDSGGYQVLEYGSVEVEPEDMARFEVDIGTDIAVPLDKPTGYGLQYSKAKEYVEITLRNASRTLEVVRQERRKEQEWKEEGKATTTTTSMSTSSGEKLNNNSNGLSDVDTLWAGPIQGAEHLDLVDYSANALREMDFEVMALGSPVEVMESYEFATLAQMIAAAKRAVPAKPLHLFGAGHPLTIPLAIALGCDTFDSASYMLYAKDGRYMHANGTARLQDIAYLPCCCPVCSSTTAKDLKDMEPERRIVQVAKHNLYVLKAEVDSAKQAIMDGRLWEHVMQKARAHPKLMEAVEFFKDLKMLESGTCVFKDKALFLYHPVDQHRPEARRFRSMLSGFKTAKKKLILYPDTQIHPFYSTKDFASMRAKFADAQICSYNPFLGIIPAEVSDIFPAAHNLIPRTSRNGRDYPTFAESLNGFLSQNHFEEITIVADDFMRQIIDSGAEMKAEGAERIENNSMAKIRVIDYEDGVFLRL